MALKQMTDSFLFVEASDDTKTPKMFLRETAIDKLGFEEREK